MQVFLPYPGRLIGIDYGSKRLGIAVSDAMQTTALPKVVLPSGDFSVLEALLKEVQGVGIVVGLPQNFSGDFQKIGIETKVFMKNCEERFRLPIFTVDERLTSRQARHDLKKTSVIDDVAATIILQMYLDLAQTHRKNYV